ncbi:MAG: hypothetical protein OHK0039_36810 [Bacteroidia bacterium]
MHMAAHAPIHDRLLWQLFGALDAAERAYFVRWLWAEHGDRQQYMQRLAASLVAAWPEVPTLAALWAALYPDLPYDDARLRKLMGDLALSLETFLAVQGFRQHEDARDHYLLRELDHRGQPALFLRLYRRQARKLATEPQRNARHFRNRYLLEQTYRRYRLKYQPQGAHEDTHALRHALQTWLRLEQAQLDFLDKGRSQSLKQPQPPAPEEPLLQLYAALQDLVQGTDRADARAVRQMIQTRQHLLDPDEQPDLFNLLLNHHIRQWNISGDTHHAAEILELYRWGIDSGLVFRDRALAWEQYKNVITICLRMGRYDDAWQYLHSLQTQLPEQLRQEAYDYNLGQYYFATAQYESVVQVYRNHRFALPLYDVQARSYLIQAHYELEGPGKEWLISQVESLVRYLRRQSLPALHRRSFYNLHRSLLRLMTASRPRQLQKLRAAVAALQPIAQQRWLERKIDERLTTPG